MIKYMITSPRFIGELVFGFETNFLNLVYMDLSSVSDDETMHTWCLHNIPTNYSILEGWLKASKTMVLTEIPEDLSFDTFYKKYGYKVNKKESENVWKRLSNEKRTLALKGIEKYNKHVTKAGVAKAYPSTYLNGEYWENEY